MDAAILFSAALSRHQAGALEEASALYRQVAQMSPDDPAPLVNLAMALKGLGRPLPAAEAYLAALVRRPAMPPVWNNLANALAEAGRLDAAGIAWRNALALAPAEAPPYANLASAALAMERPLPAERAARHALMLDPGNAGAANNLAIALLALGQDGEAFAIFHHLVARHPDLVDAAVNLAGALMDRGLPGPALALARRAVTVAPDEPVAWNNLGNAFKAAGRLAEAADAFARALRLAPHDDEVRFNAALVMLKRGRFAEGWQAYEARRRTPKSGFRGLDLAGEAWDGQPLAGRRLLLYAEQGLGDVLQFCRYAPLIAELAGGEVILRVYPPLVRLLASLPGRVGIVASDAPLPAFDCHLPLMSAPSVMDGALAGIPGRTPYLSADPADRAVWAQRFAGLAGLKVGLVWAGDPRPGLPLAHFLDRRRSLALAALAPLAQLKGISWISLQKGTPALQAVHPPAGMDLLDIASDLHDFADTAAAIANLDLVITVDTSVAHLAGALGKPVWILSRFDGCWRWLDGRADTPWYPTACLFHQPAPGDWAAPLAAMAERLAALTEERGA